VLLADLLDLGEPRLALRLGTVELDHKGRGDPDRVSGVHGLLGRLDREGVHHLDRGGDDAGGDDVADDVARGPDGGKVREEGADRLRGTKQPHCDLRGDPERAFGADEHPAQVGSRLLAGVSAERDHRAVGQHHLGRQHVVRGEPVLEAVRAAGVLRDVAADRAHLLAAGVGREVQPVRRGRCGDVQVGHARLDDRPPVDRVDLEHPLQPRDADDDPVRHGQRPAREAGAGPARHERHPVFRAHPYGRRHLRGIAGEQHQFGNDAVSGQPVALVRAAPHRVRDDPIRGQHLLERRPDRR
jgi:hypothetical protein